jgi:AcrR family transcriptional regulator
MGEVPETPEEKIVNATVQCIEKFGIDGTTIRRIADEAGVNSAAISYYFRSKDRLMEIVIDQTLKNAFDLDDVPDAGNQTPKERLIAIFSHLMEGALQYPGLTRAHLYEPFVSGRTDTPAVRRLNEFLGRLADELAARGVSLDPVELRMVLVQIASATLLSCTMPQLFDAFTGFSLQDPEIRSRYIDRLVDRLL